MNNLMRNLENVLDKASVYLVDSRELKTLMNTYRTLLRRIPDDGISNEHLKQFDKQKEILKSTLRSVEWKINDKLRERDYKSADDYAEVTYRISKALIDINSILRHRTLNNHRESMAEKLTIENGKMSLTQVPLRIHKVRIHNREAHLYEVSNVNEVKENTFYVDYDFGDVYFDKFNEGKIFNVFYMGKGGNLRTIEHDLN